MENFKSDRSGKYLTVVYKDVQAGEEAKHILDNKKVVAMAWGHSIDEVNQLQNIIEQEATK